MNEKQREVAYLAVVIFLIAIFFLCASCNRVCDQIEDGSASVAFLQDSGQLAIRGSAINTGTCPAREVWVNVKVRNNAIGEIVFETDLLLGTIYPNEVRTYEIPLDGCEWGDDINVLVQYRWGRE